MPPAIQGLQPPACPCLVCSVTKMVLFALIINSVGSVNNVPQVCFLPDSTPTLPCPRLSAPLGCACLVGCHQMFAAPPPHPPPPPTHPHPTPPCSRLQILALVLIALLHLVYLRLCLPFRMRIELVAGGCRSCRAAWSACPPTSHISSGILPGIGIHDQHSQLLLTSSLPSLVPLFPLLQRWLPACATLECSSVESSSSPSPAGQGRSGAPWAQPCSSCR